MESENYTTVLYKVTDIYVYMCRSIIYGKHTGAHGLKQGLFLFSFCHINTKPQLSKAVITG